MGWYAPVKPPAWGGDLGIYPQQVPPESSHPQYQGFRLLMGDSDLGNEGLPSSSDSLCGTPGSMYAAKRWLFRKGLRRSVTMGD